jgi:cell wall-associated NlpC family hydrolase
MSATRRRPLLLAAAATVALTMLTGVARADTTPSASDSSATPTDSGTPSVSPTPTPTPSPTETTPTPTVTPTTPSATPTVPTPSKPAPSPSPTATVTPVDPALPPNDGVAPATGQIDLYLQLTAQREAAVTAVAQRQTAATIAHAVAVWYAQQGAAISLVTTQAQDTADTTQATTDDVVRELYQQGDAGLGALGTVLADGPDGFLASLDNLRMARSASDGVVNQNLVARQNLALAVATGQAYRMRLAQATSDDVKAAAALIAAKSQVAAIDAKLAQLDIAPPQVVVGPDGCPTAAVDGTLRDGSAAIGVQKLCQSAVKQAATPQAALAITWAFQHLGAVYACGGAGRMLPWRADCSSFVSRAYHEGAGIGTAGATWAPSTRDMVPWDGAKLDPHYAYVPPNLLRPGDLVLYNSCPQGGCPYRHVVMYLGSPDGGKTVWMVHTNSCGDVAHISRFYGFPTTGEPFLVARRVVALPGEVVKVPTALAAAQAAAASSSHATSQATAARWAASAGSH